MAITDGDTEVLVPLKRRSSDQPRTIQDILRQYGLAGVVIGALGWFAWTVYSNMQAQANEVFTTQQETIKAQAASVQEMVKQNAQQAEKLITVVENNTKAVNSFEKRLAVIEALVRGKGIRAEVVEPYP